MGSAGENAVPTDWLAPVCLVKARISDQGVVPQSPNKRKHTLSHRPRLSINPHTSPPPEQTIVSLPSATVIIRTPIFYRYQSSFT